MFGVAVPSYLEDDMCRSVQGEGRGWGQGRNAQRAERTPFPLKTIDTVLGTWVQPFRVEAEMEVGAETQWVTHRG